MHPLADLASPDICRIWTPEWNILLERRWWVEILDWLVCNTGAYDHVDEIAEKVEAYRAVIEDIDLDAINLRELQTRHDVKARIEEFNANAAGRYTLNKAFGWVEGDDKPLELIHWGMTSADVVDNISLIKLDQSLAWLWRLIGQDDGPAEPILLAMNQLPLRGLQGPVGTQQDLLDLLGDRELIDALNRHLAQAYGFGDRVLTNVGQVYPRSIDLMVASYVLSSVAQINANRAWWPILRGYFHMIMEYSDGQWNEGDVSTSVIRRVALPGLFLAADCAIRKVQL